MESEQVDILDLQYLNVEAQMGETLVRVVIDQEENRITIWEDDSRFVFGKDYPQTKTITEPANDLHN